MKGNYGPKGVLSKYRVYTSAERQNKGSLLSAVLRTDALVKNAVAFLKLSSFTNAAICNSRIRKSKRLFYECGFYKYPHS